jgi:N-acetylglucosaminyldiphosphoundecaprenol N-acetyl-beta-D-mannosaminyltransferase
MMNTPYWLLGLPFDVTTLAQFRQQIFAAVEARRSLVFATPNVSFLAQAQRDARFREDVLRTDFNSADGMPVVWLGRLLGIPFVERVAGSDLLDSLMAQPGPRPLRVFFFGGQEGAAIAASEMVNRKPGGLIAVGSYYPGYGSIEQMSSDAVIDAINRSGADLLIVALGAGKGHRWIEANRHQLNVPVISHLGAAINFIAGRLQRAPGFMQRTGFEWLWRIKEEPALFKRYARDGWFLLKQVCGFVLPQVLGLRRHGGTCTITRGQQGAVEAVFTGRFTAPEVAALQQLEREAAAGLVLNLQLVAVQKFDSASVGWLYARRYRNQGLPPFSCQCDATSRATLARWGAGFLAAPPASPDMESVKL